VFVAGYHPIRTRKLFYFNDPNLQKRVCPPPPLTTHRPYPYRPRQRPLEWAGMVAVAVAATAADEVQNEDKDVQHMEQPLEALQHIEPDTEEVPQDDQDLTDEGIEPTKDMQDVALRGAFDESQRHRQRHRDRNRDDGPDLGFSI
jgi:hypothetical protein